MLEVGDEGDRFGIGLVGDEDENEVDLDRGRGGIVIGDEGERDGGCLGDEDIVLDED